MPAPAFFRLFETAATPHALNVVPCAALKVAVVIPLYNHARFIGAALESLRVQTRPPDRIIIIDDGSTDGSMQAVVAYAESLPGAAATNGSATTIQTRTDFLPQSPHAGPQTTINRAVALADDCDFVTILHADDCYHPRRIEKCLEYLVERPGHDLVCTRLRLIDEAGHTLPADASLARWFSAAWSFRPVCDGQNALDLPEWLGLANFPGTTSNFFARASYLRAHPLQGYRRTYDYYALVLAALENRLGVIDAELLDHRVRPEDDPAAPDELVRETLRLNVDLARRLAPRIASEPELRRAFARYQRAAWSNVSAFRADLFNLILVEALALLPIHAADALLAGLDGERFPEVGQYPNRAIVNTHDLAAPALGPTSGLADKFYGLRAQLSAARSDVRPWSEYRHVQAALLESRWVALGRVLGVTRPITRVGGKTAPKKLARLRVRLLDSRWLRLGRRLGVASARQLLAMGGAAHEDWRG